MKVVMIGAGYVGLVSGACLASFGFDVTCVDCNPKRIDQLKKGIVPIFEPGLDSMVQNTSKSGHLKFTTDLVNSIQDAEIIFIAVGTPARRGDGEADLTYVFEAAETIAQHLNHDAVIVTKSTVPVGTTRRLKHFIQEKRPDLKFTVASNPEFLREGSAIEDFTRPDRVIVGIECERAKYVIQALYRPLYLSETPIVWTDFESAELIKYASNAFLATKITFINQIADLCEAIGGDVNAISKGMGLDRRIGAEYLHPGPGYGGSCFPKDTRALIHAARTINVPLTLVEAVVEANETRKQQMVDKIVHACEGSVVGKTLAVLGLTFKPNTDDMREAPSLTIIPELVKRGAIIKAYDPKGMEKARRLIPDITYCEDPYLTMQDANALIFLTEWNMFRAISRDRIKHYLKDPVVIDLRNIFDPYDMQMAGLMYHSIGRGVDHAAYA